MSPAHPPAQSPAHSPGHPRAPSPETIVWASPQRQAAFERWLLPLVPKWGLLPSTLALASSDASFRRYLRLAASDATGRDGARAGSLIVMDAPPPLEDVRPFVSVAQRIADAGLLATRVLAADEAHGFLLLSDLGDEPLLHTLQTTHPAQQDAWMRQALLTLVEWQSRVDATGLPPMDAAHLRAELALFPQWCVQREHGIQWDDKQAATFERVSQALINSALASPRVAVHADYMPRNLMCLPPDGAGGASSVSCAPGRLGILDFQDAMAGPITHDVISTLRDAFWSWEEERELDLAVRYWQAARTAGLPLEADFGECWRQLEWMGLWRHLRVLGIFCRLKHRDGKAHYAQDLPRFVGYCTKVAMRYAPLKPLLPLLEPLGGATVQQGFTF